MTNVDFTISKNPHGLRDCLTLLSDYFDLLVSLDVPIGDFQKIDHEHEAKVYGENVITASTKGTNNNCFFLRSVSV